MFQTTDDAEVCFPSALVEPGEKSWWFIKQRLHIHWFYVVYIAKTDEGNSTHMMFFTVLEQLLMFTSIEEITVTNVYLVSPDYMNKTQQWKMEPLQEIWLGDEPETEDQEAHIFRLTDGKYYVSSMLDTARECLLNHRMVLKV